jgi:hypothetical protein
MNTTRHATRKANREGARRSGAASASAGGRPLTLRQAFSGAGPAGLLGMLALLVTAGARLVPALGLAFYNDDYVYLDTASQRGWLEALLHPQHIGGYLRPLSRDLYFAVTYRLFETDSLAYHLVNLGLALACMVLVWLLGRRWVGPRGALLAAALFGLSHVHAVLVGWISCGQDLWALTLALLSAWLLGRGWGRLSALGFGLALLCKENVAPLPVMLLGLGLLELPLRQAARRVIPHFAVLAVWAAFYLWHRGPESSLGWDPAAALALPWRFALAAAGVEGPRLWSAALLKAVPWALVAGAACVGAAVWGLAPGRGGPRRALPWLLWTALALLPVLPVAGQWSSYYFAFPLVGLYLAAGALLEGLPPALLAPLPALLLLSGQATLTLAFNPTDTRPDPSISWVSVNRLDVGSLLCRAALAQLPRHLPSPPPRSLFVFNGLPSRNGLISGDGPAVRLLYGDPSLSACYLGELGDSTDFGRPMYAFSWNGSTLQFGFVPLQGSNLLTLKFDLELSGRTRGAIAVARYELEHVAPGPWPAWNLGYLLWEAGDTAAARVEWDRAAQGRRLTPAQVRAELDRARELPPGRDRMARLLAVLQAAPRDSAAMLAAARGMAGPPDAVRMALYFRVCRLYPRDARLLRAVRQELRACNLPTTVAILDSMIARAGAS